MGVSGRIKPVSGTDSGVLSGPSLYRNSGKRILDIFIGAPLIVVTFPLQAFLGVLVRIRLGSPVLFRQQRPGRDGQPFLMIKYRTMTDHCDAQGRLLSDTERLTPFGQFLRSTSLDELPELYNLLKGDMSLVGPRPLLMSYVDRYTPRQARRHEVRPGITGWAQVNGRSRISWEEKFEQDVYYVDNVSLRLDLKILWMTLVSVLKRQDTTPEGQVTAPEFMGHIADQ